MKTLIIIPTYNEYENIKKIIPEIFKITDKYDVSILIVDDSSTDGTKEEVLSLQKTYNKLYLLTRKAKLGLASAYIDGFKYALDDDFDNFIQMDADYSHNPMYLSIMLEKLKDNDFVIASRNIKGGYTVGWSLLRKIISKGGSIYSKLILNCPINDLTGGFNGWNKYVIEKIDFNKIISKGYSFQIEMKYRAHKAGFKHIEFPIVFENRKYGQSKMSFLIFLEALLNIIRIKIICH